MLTAQHSTKSVPFDVTFGEYVEYVYEFHLPFGINNFFEYNLRFWTYDMESVQIGL